MNDSSNSSLETFFQKRENSMFNNKLKKQKMIIESLTQIQIGMNILAFTNLNKMKNDKIYFAKIIFTIIALNLLVKNTLLVSLFRREETPTLLSSLASYNNFLFQDKNLYKIKKSLPVSEGILDSVRDP